jgi:predicted DNA binding protein
MKFLDARVRVQHPCPLCDFSKEFPGAEISSWCNVDSEIIQVITLDEGKLDEICEYAGRSFGAKQVARDANSVLLSTRDCICEPFNSVDRIADRHGSWSVPPTIFFGGWETHRIISRSKNDLRKFANDIKKVGRIEIVSLRERDRLDMLNSLGVAPVHFFDGLTDKQLRAIVAAYESGLLQVPARTRMDRVARMEGQSRSTYGEHLRKALFQIIENSYPVLKLYDRDTRGRGKK